jgi:membrane fusion protein, multidrug efflux system
MKGKQWRWAAFACFGVLTVAACKREQPQAVAPVRPVLSVIVGASVKHPLDFAGTVEPRYTTNIGSRVLGRLIARNVDVGDLVKTGEVLAAIDPKALALSVRSAAADIATAQSQLLAATNAESRQRYLRDRGVSSSAQYEQTQLSKATAEASLQQAEAKFATSKEQLGYAQLQSDSDGVVTAISGQVGQVVSPGQVVVTVAREDTREAVVDVPDDVAQALRPGSSFEVSLQLDPSIRIPGKVREIGAQADATTRTRRIRIMLEGTADLFRLGATITATVIAPAESAILLPRTALFEQDGQHFVWVVEPKTNTVAMRAVTITPRDGDRLQVNAGLEMGARVVIAGVHSLRHGQQVKLLDEAT